MTLPSHKKHQTIQRSTLRSKLIKWCVNTSLAVSVSLAPAGLFAGDGPSPLEKLRQRSANKRWEEVRGQWMPVRGQGLDIEGPKRVESDPNFIAPSRPLPDLEAGTKPESIASPTKSTVIRTAEEVEEEQSAARPFPTPSMTHKVPDPYSPELPPAAGSIVEPQSIHKPAFVGNPPKPVHVTPKPKTDTVPLPTPTLTQKNVETSEIPEWKPPQPEASAGNATLESNVPEQVVESKPQLQIQEPITLPRVQTEQPQLITPPVMTAQAEPEPYLPPAITPEADTNLIAESAASIFRPITEIQPYYDYSPTGENSTKYLCPQPNSIPESERERCPDIQSLPQTGSTDRHFAGTNFHWQASNLTHNPLYFEDVSLERYGHTYPDVIQPFVSVGKFGLQVAGLPYQMALEAPHNERYALGYYRPGECAPHLKYRIPFNGKAAVTAGAFYTGFIFLFP